MDFMDLAIKQAQIAYKFGDVPVGAVIVKNNKVIAKAYNKKVKTNLATAHAEVLAINKACKKLKTANLSGCEIFVTFEPCLMCVGAILNARIDKVFFGAYDKRFGANHMLTENNFNHTAQVVGGVKEEVCSKLLSDFFKKIRQK